MNEYILVFTIGEDLCILKVISVARVNWLKIDPNTSLGISITADFITVVLNENSESIYSGISPLLY